MTELSEAGVVSPTELMAEVAGATRPLSYYQDYTGYNPAFLGPAVAMPGLTDEQRRSAATNTAAAAGADPVVLTYTHFSVVINRRRQLAFFTAVNIDGATTVDIDRDRDRWFFDPRIAESEQIGEALYRRNALDRGHLVRRLDPVWGPAAARANDDTFHFTNCSPQHEKFNQGKDLWQGLENFILDGADVADRKVNVFTGPVLTDTDPLYKGVRLPLAFWKIVVFTRPDTTLTASAYLLDQTALIDDVIGLTSGFDPGLYRVTLADLTTRTHLDLSHLANAETTLSTDPTETNQQRVAIQADYSNVIR